ncbi:D-aminoacyl-tRNA deacylase [Francisellaceae bacterium]|nr:D-aminoacyl-tRNA deacylase [Francisellaceae bacterium]
MIALIQRVTDATVIVENKEVANIQQGILALIGIEKHDDVQAQEKLLKKLLAYRIFDDGKGHMNLNLQQVEGALLLVPQFTLAANTNSGLRPSFSEAAPPEFARQVFTDFVSKAQHHYDKIQSGIFGADMKVSLTNDGPVTFWLQT